MSRDHKPRGESRSFALVSAASVRTGVGFVSLTEVAARLGVRPLLVQRLVRLGVVDPVEGSQDLFFPDVTLYLGRVLRLRRDLGVNYSGAAVILELQERIERLESRLRQFEET